MISVAMLDTPLLGFTWTLRFGTRRLAFYFEILVLLLWFIVITVVVV